MADDAATLARPAEVAGPVEGRAAELLTPEALAFLAELHRTFDARRLELLAARRTRARSASTPARAPTSWPRPRPCATATGASRRSRPTCRTAGSRSPARPTAR